MNEGNETDTGELVARVTDTMGYIECARVFGTDEAEEYRAEQEECDRLHE